MTIIQKGELMIRFPIDCPMECPHLQAWDMSVDDWTYVCNKLSIQIDGCDTLVKWLLPTCPIERGEQDGGFNQQTGGD